MNCSLGGLIKDYRLQKNISQLEISFALGWKEASRLSRIEQGRVDKPKREVLNKIMNAMKVTEEEKGQLLLAGGYLPTDEEIDYVRKELGPVLEKWRYPADIYDFSWRLVLGNSAKKLTYQVNTKLQKWIEKTRPNLLELQYHPDIVQNSSYGKTGLEERNKYRLKELVEFLHVQKNRKKEKWYVQLVSKLMHDSTFRTLWEKAVEMESDSSVVVSNQGERSAVNPKDKTKWLKFYFFDTPYRKDVRFTIQYSVPADKETFEYFE